MGWYKADLSLTHYLEVKFGPQVNCCLLGDVERRLNMDGGLILRSWWFGWTGVPNFQTSDGHMTSELYTMERFGGRSLGPVCMMSEHPCLGFSQLRWLLFFLWVTG